MMKNILYTIDTNGPGGGERVVLNLIRNLDRNKYTPHIILSERRWLFDQIVSIGLIPEIMKAEGSFNVGYLRKLIGFLKKKEIHLIHSHFLGSNVYSSIAGLFCRVPAISTFHGRIDINPSNKMIRMKFRLINLGSRYVVFVSHNLKKHYLRTTTVSKRKSITIHNGIDYQRFSIMKNDQLREELGYSADHVLIGSVGNIRNAKGYDVLLKAACIVKKTAPECKFIIAGEGNGKLYEDLITLRHELALDDCVMFLGFRADIENILSGLDLFVLPSSSEGFSICTIEAMAAGVPVIVTDCDGPRDIVTPQRDGIIVRPCSPEAIAEGIKLCLSHPKLRQSLASNSRGTVQKRFGIEAMMKKYSNMYDTCFN